VLSFISPAEHILSKSLRPRRTWLRPRELCLLTALLIASACGGAHTLAPLTATSIPGGQIAWLSPLQDRDAKAMSRWRAAVGSPLVAIGSEPERSVSADTITVVSWNVALDGGDVVQLVRGLQTAAPHRPIVLLLQEAFRSGDDVPSSPAGSAFAASLGRSNRAREIDDVARALGFSVYYVPSMRNGGRPEDRGNAVLSSVPLGDLAAIELPFEHQRRVAVAATIVGRTSHGEPWSLRLASVHLDNLVGARNGWIATEYGRARQARGLREAFDNEKPLVLAGDFNTWFGFSDQAYVETARAFPQTRVQDTRRTFRGLLRLDHVFYRLPPGWKAEVRRADSSLGSDHYPLITTITF
jgi:endonuclease/exonuclease/phosphatase family metal-dependent hydrolase